MGTDITLPIEDGFVNVRVGAIIEKDGRLLMVRNADLSYCYSVGGRIQFGESAEEAIRREVREETGWDLEIEQLGFVHEDFFWGDPPSKRGRLIYEIGFYYYMKTPADFEPRGESLTEDGTREQLEWVDPAEDTVLYPDFFHTALQDRVPYVRHILKDERNIPKQS